MTDKFLSWSGDATILNDSGQVAFLVSGKTMSLRGSRILKDAAGNPVCAMKEKVYFNLVFNKKTDHNCLQHTGRYCNTADDEHAQKVGNL